MSPKRWFIMLLILVLLITGSIVTLNVLVDPFGVFGSPLLDWPSYGMTNNPRSAKYTYVNQRIGEFDAFIVGPSGASGLAPHILEHYTGLRWYNMFHYGADMAFTGRLAEHLIETHRPRSMILAVPIISASGYNTPAGNIHYYEPLQSFWRLPFLFANPGYAADKLSNWSQRSYLQQPFDVFIAETGTYNKTLRDAEARGSLEEFLTAYPALANPYFGSIPLPFIDENMAAIASVIETAARFGTDLTIVTTPMLAQELSAYDEAEILAFYEALAAVSGGFWDFSFSAVSSDPRFFDDTTHFSNNVGYMMLARMFDDDSRFVPADLGIWVSPANAAYTAAQFSAFEPRPPESTTIPILLYHDIVFEADSYAVSPDLFEEHMSALYEAGFTAIPLTALADYVFYGTALPERAVVITFDDGYLSNYTNAFPILERYGFHATIFAMGVSFGRDTHAYSGLPIRPRFGAEEARRMVDSGLISIQSHSYDMHQMEGFDPYPIRRGILRMENEPEQYYVNIMRADHARFAELIYAATGEEVFAFAFPFGWHDTFSGVVLRNIGLTMTLSSRPGRATIVRGLPQSLFEMNRMSLYSDVSGERLVEIVTG